MTDSVFTLIDVLTASWGADEAQVTDTFAIVAHLAGTAVLLLVAARLAGAVHTNFALQTVSVVAAYLDAQAIQTLFSPGTVAVALALEMAHTILALMLGVTAAIRAERWNPDTALLGCGHASKALRTRALHILANHLALSIGSTGPLLVTGVDALEVDAHL